MRHVPNWKLVLCATAFTALGCIVPTHRAAQGQSSFAGWADREDYIVEPAKPVSFNVGPVLRGGTFADADEEKKFADFFNLAVFPNITKKENRQSQRDDVIEKLRNYFRICEKLPDQQVFNKLAELTLTYMKKVAGDNRYHPAARVNAVLAIGEVNSPVAAKVLLDTAFGRGQAFAFRIAAMTGLLRMSSGPSGREALSSPDVVPLLVKDMVMFAKFHATKKDDGIIWMRGQAADLLADMGNVGANGEVPPALLSMLNDKDLPIPIRTKAARALGKLNYGGSPPAAGPYLTALAEFADDAYAAEQPANRARVRQVAHDITEIGMKAFEGSTLANHQALIEGLKKTLQALNEETKNPMSADELKASIAKAKTALDSLVKKKE